MCRKFHAVMGLTILALIVIAAPAQAQNKPIQLALFTPVQIFPETDPIAGVRLNLIYGRSVSVSGLDLGLVNHTTTGKSMGVQWGTVGFVESNFMGWQNNAVNVTKGNFEGFQWGIVNYANYANGLQLGLVNYSMSMKGLQIGLVNIIRLGGQFPVFPFVNWSF